MACLEMIRAALAKFVIEYCSGRHGARPWWYLILDDPTMKIPWASLSSRVFLMSPHDTTTLLDMCGLVSISRKRKNQTAPAVVLADEIEKFILQFELEDVMRIIKKQVPNDKKERWYIRLGQEEEAESLSVIKQAQFSREKAPRNNCPEARESLIKFYVAGYLSSNSKMMNERGILSSEEMKSKPVEMMQDDTSDKQQLQILRLQVLELEERLRLAEQDRDHYREIVDKVNNRLYIILIIFHNFFHSVNTDSDHLQYHYPPHATTIYNRQQALALAFLTKIDTQF